MIHGWLQSLLRIRHRRRCNSLHRNGPEGLGLYALGYLEVTKVLHYHGHEASFSR
jgi:hypothetical protein